MYPTRPVQGLKVVSSLLFGEACPAPDGDGDSGSAAACGPTADLVPVPQEPWGLGLRGNQQVRALLDLCWGA